MTDKTRLEDKIAARHAEVLGQPPRIAPIEQESAREAVATTTQALRGGVGGDKTAPPLDGIPEIMFTMCRYPELWQKLMDLSIQIQGPAAVLPARDRKLAILRTAWLCQAPYEWGEHVNQARLRTGFTSEDVERVIEGSSAPEWDGHERAILRAAEELHQGQMVSNETWAILSDQLSDHQLVELVVVVGQFTATAFLQNTLRLRLEGANKGLAGR